MGSKIKSLEFGGEWGSSWGLFLKWARFVGNRMHCCHQKNMIQLERLENLVLTMFFQSSLGEHIMHDLIIFFGWKPGLLRAVFYEGNLIEDFPVQSN